MSAGSSGKKSVIGRPFQKGQSGNPSGRPKQTKAQKDALEEMKKLTPLAVKTVEEILRNKSASDSVRLRAAEIVFDRMYGKAETRVKADVVTGDGDFVLRIVSGDGADD